MLREEHLIGVVGPSGTDSPNVVWTKTVAEAAVGSSSSDICNEAAHADQCADRCGLP
jgi:hypothetical protein